MTIYFQSLLLSTLVLTAVFAPNCAHAKQALRNAPAEGKISIANANTQEHIHFRKVGQGKQLLVLIPGNNTSGAVYHGLLNQLRAQTELRKAFTALALDYRGSGKSSYNTPIQSLSDFAADFDKVLQHFSDLKEYQITLVGYSMGFAVAMDLADMAPKKYQTLVGIAPVGTRGKRIVFNDSTSGIDDAGHPWKPGDWVPSSDDKNQFSATHFHQRAWQGKSRNFQTVKSTWDALVFNDYIKFDINTAQTSPNTLQGSPLYRNALTDSLTVQYMPASLFFTHNYNISGVDLPIKTNSDGTRYSVPTKNKMASFKGKNVLLIKAETAMDKWRGDLVIEDHEFFDTAEDLTHAGASVNTLLIGADQGYDHGITVTHAGPLSKLIASYLQGTLSKTLAEDTLSATVQYQ